MTGTSGPSLLAYSVAGAAHELSISVRSMYRLLNAGELQAVKIGNRTLILRCELVRYLRRCTRYQAPQHPAFPKGGTRGRPGDVA